MLNESFVYRLDASALQCCEYTARTQQPDVPYPPQPPPAKEPHERHTSRGLRTRRARPACHLRALCARHLHHLRVRRAGCGRIRRAHRRHAAALSLHRRLRGRRHAARLCLPGRFSCPAGLRLDGRDLDLRGGRGTGHACGNPFARGARAGGAPAGAHEPRSLHRLSRRGWFSRFPQAHGLPHGGTLRGVRLQAGRLARHGVDGEAHCPA